MDLQVGYYVSRLSNIEGQQTMPEVDKLRAIAALAKELAQIATIEADKLSPWLQTVMAGSVPVTVVGFDEHAPESEKPAAS